MYHKRSQIVNINGVLTYILVDGAELIVHGVEEILELCLITNYYIF